MATLDEIMAEWDIDANIDENYIDSESVKVPKLHAKYVRHLMQGKLKLSKLQNDFAVLKKIKFRYYRGELTRDELKEQGWEQWQYAKPLKNEMDQFLEGDTELNAIKLKIEYINTMIYLLESILSQIKARDWQIKSVVEWKKFLAGA